MWRLWTKGWGPSGWWYWFAHDAFPLWCAFRVPRWLAYWVVIRVFAATGENPNFISWSDALDAWQRGEGK